MKEIMISVVCLTYNHEKYIRQALDSILMQETEYEYEVLIGEDCSPDQSREILEEYHIAYPNIFQVFYREKNLGATRNAFDLFCRTKGKYIIMLELDDFWIDSSKLQRQTAFLETHTEFVGCAHESIRVNEEGQEIREEDSEKLAFFYEKAFTMQDFLEQGFLFQTASLMYRNFWNDGKDYSVLYRSHNLVGDLTINSLLLSRGNLFIFPDPMSCYRIVIKKNGTNARSVSRYERANSMMQSARQLYMLYQYFDKKIDYSVKRELLLSQYLMGVLKREPQFSVIQWFNMLFHSDIKTINKFLKHMRDWLFRSRGHRE